MATLIQETTANWKGCNVPNHKYLMEGSKAIGYIRAGTSTLIRFPKPMYFDKRERTFEKVMDV